MSSSESEPVTAMLTLQGVWLHDPLDASGTIVQFLYGGAASQGSVDAMGQGALYAGRMYQVTDYGEHEAEAVAVTITVPFGQDWAADMADLKDFAQARRALVFRDGRGRNMPATMAGYSERDQRWGTQVTFTMSRADEVA